MEPFPCDEFQEIQSLAFPAIIYLAISFRTVIAMHIEIIHQN